MQALKRVTVLFLCLALFCVGLVSSAAAGSPPGKPARWAKPLVLHPRFRLVATGVYSVFTNGRYVFLSDHSPTGGGTAGKLIDEQTGRHVTVRPRPGCNPTAIGGPWLLFTCDALSPQPVELYALATGHWQAVASTPGQAIAVGADWIEYDVSCGQHCPDTIDFQSIQTGQVQTLPAWRPGGTTIPDLNSRSLAAKVCSPLRVPEGFHPYGLPPQPGSLTFYGRSAIAFAYFGPSGNQSAQIDVERCGTRRRQAIVSNVSGGYPFAANSRVALAHGVRTTGLVGVFLPSFRRFTLPLALGQSVAALSSRTLFVLGDTGRLFATTSPSPPRR